MGHAILYSWTEIQRHALALKEQEQDAETGPDNWYEIKVYAMLKRVMIEFGSSFEQKFADMKATTSLEDAAQHY